MSSVSSSVAVQFGITSSAGNYLGHTYGLPEIDRLGGRILFYKSIRTSRRLGSHLIIVHLKTIDDHQYDHHLVLIYCTLITVLVDWCIYRNYNYNI